METIIETAELQANESNNTNINNGMTKTTNSSIISGMSWNKSSDGTPVVCCILKDSSASLHTKTTIRSYLTALEGAIGAIDFVSSHLNEGDINIISGAKITWERTVYAPNTPHTRSDGNVVILQEEDVIDHIIKVDLRPIHGLLLDKKLDEMGENISPLKEKMLLKNFEVQL